MGCASCATSKNGQPKGCKNNGTCGTDSCNKLTVFDWLSNMSLPNGAQPFNWIEVRFKNGRKQYYKNTEKLTLSIGDVVATEAESGHDVGMVTLTGELVKVQMKRKKIPETSEKTLKIFRKATQRDIDIWIECRDKEEAMQVKARHPSITPPIATPCDSPKVVSLKTDPNEFPAIVLFFSIRGKINKTNSSRH